MRRLSKSEEPHIKDKFPNEAEISAGQKQQVHENNYFKDHELELVRKKYVRFSVLMEYLHDVLELDLKTTTIEQFGLRVRDLVYAQQRES